MHTSTRAARWTGAAYLALALGGMLGFLLLRPQLHTAAAPAETIDRIVGNPFLAQAVVGLELVVVIAQAAAAVGFYSVLRADRPVAAFATASFGMANALAVLSSAAMLITAVAVAADPAVVPGADATAVTALLFTIADAFWKVGAVFFGLWLIPMGWYAVSTGRFPRALGWILVAGGGGYVVSALLAAAAPSLPSPLVDLLVIPATVGELWMIGYLLVRGIRPVRQLPATTLPQAASKPRSR